MDVPLPTKPESQSEVHPPATPSQLSTAGPFQPEPVAVTLLAQRLSASYHLCRPASASLASVPTSQALPNSSELLI